jgi:hypothetical protein
MVRGSKRLSTGCKAGVVREWRQGEIEKLWGDGLGLQHGKAVPR